MSLDKWLAGKKKRDLAEADSPAEGTRAATEEVKQKEAGFFSRLMESANKPL